MAVFERKNWKMLHYLLILQCQRKGKTSRCARQAKPALRQRERAPYQLYSASYQAKKQ